MSSQDDNSTTDPILRTEGQDPQLSNTYLPPGSATATTIEKSKQSNTQPQSSINAKSDQQTNSDMLNVFSNQSSNYYLSSTSNLRDGTTTNDNNKQSTSTNNKLYQITEQQRVNGGKAPNNNNQHENPLLTLANSVSFPEQSSSNTTNGNNGNLPELDWSRKAADIALRLEGKQQAQRQQQIQQQQSTTKKPSARSTNKPSTNSPLPPGPLYDSTVGSDGSKNIRTIGNSTSSNSNKTSKTREPKVFQCTFPGCGKIFSRKMNLNSHHQSTHEHQKPFKCSTCDQYFARHSDRRRHESNQHGDRQNGGFICTGTYLNGEKWGCNKIFKRKDGLTAHWRSQKAKKKCLRNNSDNLELDLYNSRLSTGGGNPASTAVDVTKNGNDNAVDVKFSPSSI